MQPITPSGMAVPGIVTPTTVRPFCVRLVALPVGILPRAQLLQGHQFGDRSAWGMHLFLLTLEGGISHERTETI